jgi:hypothetical protein
MNRFKKILKWAAGILLTIISLSIILFFWYCNSLDKINPLTVNYYEQLKIELTKQGHKDNLLVISSKRANWHNQILTLFITEIGEMAERAIQVGLDEMVSRKVPEPPRLICTLEIGTSVRLGVSVKDSLPL